MSRPDELFDDRELMARMRDEMSPDQRLVDELTSKLHADTSAAAGTSIGAGAGTSTGTSIGAGAASEPLPVSRPRRRRRWAAGLSVAAAVFLVAALGFAVLRPGGVLSLAGIKSPFETDPSAQQLTQSAAAAPMEAVSSYEDLYATLCARMGVAPLATAATWSDDMLRSLKVKSVPASSIGYGDGAMLTAPATGERDSAAESSTSGLDAKSAAPTSPSPSTDYSTTNTQVAGIDEADVVKTDGDFLYMILRGSEVVIASADGANTKEVSRFTPEAPDGQSNCGLIDLYLSGDVLVVMSRVTLQVGTQEDLNAPIPQGGGTSGGSLGGSSPGYPGEIEPAAAPQAASATSDSPTSSPAEEPMASGPANAASPTEPQDAVAPYPSPYYPSMRSVTQVSLYDVSDARAPVLIDLFAQDGYHTTSRLMDNVLYLVTNHAPSYLPYEVRPYDYLPLLYGEGCVDATVPSQHIYPTPGSAGTGYTVVTALDLKASKRVASLTVVGSAGTVYMGHNNLYVAESFYQEGEDDFLAQEGANRYIKVDSSYDTRIARIPVGTGQLALAASAVVPGALLNQFSLDEFDGHLRVATSSTVYTSFYILNEDTGYRSHDYGAQSDAMRGAAPTQTNALYVLDASLAIVGRIEGLAPNERIYSTRFDGDVGYVVTFRQVDPLFTIDLSDPRRPKVTNALKIPGFSQYLHPFGDGLLLGIGMNASDTGRVSTMKLAMFDTSDPYDVWERDKHLLSTTYSPALYNHKSVFADVEKGLVGFPTNDSSSARGYNGTGLYLVYSYRTPDFGMNESGGFFEKLAVSLPLTKGIDYGTYSAYDDRYSSYEYVDVDNTRGLYVGDSFYIVSGDNILVFDLASFKQTASVKLS
ncbi:MAG: beta-propeller domain-containing protein [Coriobacteriales bacterium]|jgi:uncharacterized secreted protein with C-terminal beta-propeller domain|nr:beta-propeller domain-containing protein [Coriobacteriales bacterium]